MKRRSLIAGVAGATTVLGASRLFAQDTPSAPTCTLITQDVTGPFMVDARHLRSDVTEGQAGVPLLLDFEVVDTFRCQPLPGAIVRIWHCNAEGLYSAVNNLVLDADMKSTGEVVDLTAASFLRGEQKTDERGRVQFRTIVPGWYYPRPVHIHLKVYPPTFGEEATTQLYFKPDFLDAVYRHEAYAARGPAPNRMDGSQASGFDSSDAPDLWLQPQADGDGFRVTKQLGVTFYGTNFGELTDWYRQG